MLFKATIEILLEADSEAEACDTVSETMRPLLRGHGGDAFLDWQYTRKALAGPDQFSTPVQTDGAEFSEWADGATG